MARVYLFSDEAGDFTFRHGPGASEYFLIATVCTTDCHEGDDLHALRRELAWRGQVIESFHAVNDRPKVRTDVFRLIAASGVRIDVTALRKQKAQPHLSGNTPHFYKMASYLHFKYVIPRVATSADDLMVVASSLQIRKKRQALHQSVHDVVQQVSPTRRFVTAFHRNDTDPCLQLADYAAWAVQRDLEMGDPTWLDIIRPRVASVFQPWRHGTVDYY